MAHTSVCFGIFHGYFGIFGSFFKKKKWDNCDHKLGEHLSSGHLHQWKPKKTNKQHSAPTEAEKDRGSPVDSDVRGNYSWGDATLSVAHIHKQT